MYKALRNLKERLGVWFVDSKEEDMSCFGGGGGGQFYLGKHINRIEHEGIGTRARI